VWFFRSPDIVFGEDALEHLASIHGKKALIVTDENVAALGFVERVQDKLAEAGLESLVFAEVEPNPSLGTVLRGAEVAARYGADWIVGLGGGSCIDAAKGVFVLYERPDLEPDGIAPTGKLYLRRKSRLAAVPTTSGTGAEATWPIVLTDEDEHRKLSVGHPENIPDLAIVDPVFVEELPCQLTADTGMDVLAHAVEGYTSHWRNDFSDGLCLKAAQLVFDFLPRACREGGRDPEARTKMHNAATIAGLAFGNSMAAMAHGMGHSLGAVFPVPHGRAVGMLVPYTIEFTARGFLPTRYGDLTRILGLASDGEDRAAGELAAAIRDLAREVGQPISLQEAGISASQFEARLPKLVENALNDSATTIALRYPEEEEMERVFRYAFDGRPVDF
jgi:alcohol dehydrogenase class IV